MGHGNINPLRHRDGHPSPIMSQWLVARKGYRAVPKGAVGSNGWPFLLLQQKPLRQYE